MGLKRWITIVKDLIINPLIPLRASSPRGFNGVKAYFGTFVEIEAGELLSEDFIDPSGVIETEEPDFRAISLESGERVRLMELDLLLRPTES